MTVKFNQILCLFLDSGANKHSLRLTAGSSQKASVNGTKSSKGNLGTSMLVWGRVPQVGLKNILVDFLDSGAKLFVNL